MEAAQPLRLVSDNDLLFLWPDGTGDALTREQVTDRIKGLLYENEGLTKTIKQKSAENARLEKRIAADEDPLNHAKGREIVALFKRWQDASGHTKTVFGGPRVRLVKARLKDGFPMALGEGDEPGPSLELAIDGICSHPFASYDKRSATQKAGYKRKDGFDLALKDEKHVEELARLGWKARRDGWTTEGWPA